MVHDSSRKGAGTVSQYDVSSGRRRVKYRAPGGEFYKCRSCEAKATIRDGHIGVDHEDNCARLVSIERHWPLLATRVMIERHYSGNKVA